MPAPGLSSRVDATLSKNRDNPGPRDPGDANLALRMVRHLQFGSEGLGSEVIRIAVSSAARTSTNREHRPGLRNAG